MMQSAAILALTSSCMVQAEPTATSSSFLGQRALFKPLGAGLCLDISGKPYDSVYMHAKDPGWALDECKARCVAIGTNCKGVVMLEGFGPSNTYCRFVRDNSEGFDAAAWAALGTWGRWGHEVGQWKRLSAYPGYDVSGTGPIASAGPYQAFAECHARNFGQWGTTTTTTWALFKSLGAGLCLDISGKPYDSVYMHAQDPGWALDECKARCVAIGTNCKGVHMMADLGLNTASCRFVRGNSESFDAAAWASLGTWGSAVGQWKRLSAYSGYDVSATGPIAFAGPSVTAGLNYTLFECHARDFGQWPTTTTVTSTRTKAAANVFVDRTPRQSVLGHAEGMLILLPFAIGAAAAS